MIGEIIKEQRILINMTRETLAEGVCTEKYVYLIEKNERNPSAYLLDCFSEKLGIDLFEYYQYLNFKNKSLVVEYKKKIDRYIQLGDMEKLKEVGQKASELEDFKQEPLSYDIKIINLIYGALVEGKTSQAIIQLNDIFATGELNIDRLTLINGYTVLSSCYQLEGQLDKARQVIEIAYEMIKNKTELPRYYTVIINVMISLTSLLYNSGEYDKLIKYALDLIEFQEENAEYSRIYYADFYLAFAYYNTNKLSKSKEHFMRGIHAANLFKNKMDINFIVKMKEFSQIVDKLNIDQHYVQELYKLTD